MKTPLLALLLAACLGAGQVAAVPPDPAATIGAPSQGGAGTPTLDRTIQNGTDDADAPGEAGRNKPVTEPDGVPLPSSGTTTAPQTGKQHGRQ